VYREGYSDKLAEHMLEEAGIEARKI